VGVTPHQGARESRAQGEVAQVVGCPKPVRYARCGTPKQAWALGERCSQEATGELLEIERLMSSLERGHWKSARMGNSLVAYSTACPVRVGARQNSSAVRQKWTLSFDLHSMCSIIPYKRPISGSKSSWTPWDGTTRHQAYQGLRVTLHALRDRLTLEGMAQLGAQLPLLIRGVYDEG
jgi:hypothetical protein